MNEISVAGVITLFPTTKTEQSTFVEQLINNVLSGDINPLTAEIQMCNIEQVVKKYRSDERIKEAVLEEAEKFSSKTFDYGSASVNIKEVGVKYNYEEAGHPKYDEIINRIKSLNEEKKSIEQIMKNHKEVWVYTDPDTGEISEIKPLAKSSTTQAVITIKK